jgi:hypothetical protein
MARRINGPLSGDCSVVIPKVPLPESFTVLLLCIPAPVAFHAVPVVVDTFFPVLGSYP